MEPILPKDFVARYKLLLGEENKEFLRYCKMPLRKCIRVNTLKVDDVSSFEKELKEKGWILSKVPWCEYAYFVEGVEPGKTEEYFLGKIYVQEASSLIPTLVLSPDQEDFVFDTCAAPGSKTTHLAQIMKNRGCIVANDESYSRIKSLRFNLDLMGVLNTVVSVNDMRRINIHERFDKVLSDVPCSCEGTIRKNWKVMSRWNVRMINFLSAKQKNIVKSAFKSLKRNGILVYSTCTLSPEENEEVVDYAVSNCGAVVEKTELEGLKTRQGILEWKGKSFNEQVKNCARIYPQDNDSEGFFVARMRKL